MKKVGKLETVASIAYKAYEVIEIDGSCYAGIDAFSYPENQHDLRSLGCLSIPAEWRWTEQYEPYNPNYGEPKKITGGKYFQTRGPEAKAKIEEIISRHELGSLALNDRANPYVIPVNHGYVDGVLYMHCGKIGKKLTLIRKDPNATYMVYGPAMDTPPDVRSCHLPYESIIFYGKITICDDPEEKERAIRALTDHYGTPHQHGFADMIEVLRFEIHHATARTGRFKPGLNRDLYYYSWADQN